MHPVEIRFHGVESSEALSTLIRERSAQLSSVSERIQSVHVLVDAPHHHRRHGNHYRVRIELTVPGGDIVVGHQAEDRTTDEDAYQAVRHAFDVMRRRLAAAEERIRGKERAHADRRPSIRPVR